MAAVVGVIVSWLEREVIAAAPRCFYASLFTVRLGGRGGRVSRPLRLTLGQPPCLVRHKHKLRALRQRRSMQTRRRPAPDNAFPRIQHVAPPPFTVHAAQVALIQFWTDSLRFSLYCLNVSTVCRFIFIVCWCWNIKGPNVRCANHQNTTVT